MKKKNAPVERHALCEELADAVAAVQLGEACMRLLDEAPAERAQPKLRHGAVVHDHRRHVHAVHLVLHACMHTMLHAHHVRTMLQVRGAAHCDARGSGAIRLTPPTNAPKNSGISLSRDSSPAAFTRTKKVVVTGPNPMRESAKYQYQTTQNNSAECKRTPPFPPLHHLSQSFPAARSTQHAPGGGS